MPDQKPDEIAIFAVAAEMPADEQGDFLDEACQGDAELRARLASYLNCARGFGPLDAVRPRVEVTVEQPETVKTVDSGKTGGSRIGPYKIREKIAEGGMGAVYVAEQSKPVRRKVALKVIRPGVVGPNVVARFEAERQALAMMDHPNIARVLDGGATDDELPYFVMELVQGFPITEYCDQKRLTTRQRLQLFVDVCRAVQHAHQKGIIHRDLKPSNILVAEIDGKAVPKVIDFGVAKALHQKLTDETVYTQFSQMVGTPLYMSPEQAGMGVIDIDTRSDVYSLGVVLYQLLTGETPFNQEQLKNATFDEMRRIIREDEPPRPSAMVSTLAAQAQSTIAERRGVDVRKLQDSLSGELDWLVMKALDKDRNRRYESANGLAADIERYLNDEPVEACPPSTAYRLKKYAHRNRGKLLAASFVSITLLIGAGSLAAWKWDKSRKQRQVAAEVQRSIFAARAAMESGDLEMAEKQLASARVRAESAGPIPPPINHDISEIEGEIQERQQQQERFARFLDLSESYWTNNDDLHDTEGPQALELYGVLSDEAWTEKLGSSYLTGDEQALVRERAYEILLQLASVDPWTRNDKKIHKSMHYLDLAAAFHEPTRSYYRLRQEGYDFLKQWDRKQEFEELYDNTSASTVFDHFLTGQRAGQIDGGLKAAIGHYEKALEIQPDNFRALFFLAYRLNQLERRDEAAQAYRGCLALRPDHAVTMGNLASVLSDLGRMDDALSMANRAVQLRPDHKWSWQARAILHGKIGENQKALDDFAKALEIEPDAQFYNNRGTFYGQIGEHAKARSDYDRAIEMAPRNAMYLAKRARTYCQLKQPHKALFDVSKAIELEPRNLSHYATRSEILLNLDRVAEAQADSVKMIELNHGDARGYAFRGWCLLREEKIDAAVRDFTKTLELDPENTLGLNGRAGCYHAQKEWELAKADLERALEITPNDGVLHGNLAQLHCKLGEFDAAIRSAKKAIELSPYDAWVYGNLADIYTNCREQSYRKPKLAVELATKAVELDAHDVENKVILGMALYRHDEFGKAAEVLATSLESLSTKKMHPLLFLAMCHWQLGNREEALSFYDQAVEWLEGNQPEFEDEVEMLRVEAESLLEIRLRSSP